MSNDSALLDDTLIQSPDFKEFSFPITFEFKIGTLANDFVARDVSGRTLAYVRQKMFKFKEAIKVYGEESKTHLLYEINADRVIDFNACYAFTDADGKAVGKIGRRGMRSLWKASYDIFNAGGVVEFRIQEENPWSKVMDTLMAEVPLVGIFTGYMFNPKYAVISNDGTKVARLSKEASFFGRRFKLEKLADLKPGDSERIMLSFMMMALLERRRG